MSVNGVGGLFFRAKDPNALRQWYRTHLGVGGEGYNPWEQAAGPTLFMPFSEKTDYWPQDKQWMINYRVSDLEQLIAQLRASGIVVTQKAEWDTPETGKFARIADPEGNQIELWQPPAE